MSTPDPAEREAIERLRERLGAVRERLDAALARAGRDPGAARLVAVSKKHPADAVRRARAAGVLDVGENYAQEMVAKMDALAADPGPAEPALRWHFIGQLQRNKAKLVVGRAALIHAVDSAPLARAIERQAAAHELVQDLLVAVNIGGEAQKSGVSPDAVADLLAAIDELPHVRAAGLMTMPPLAHEPEQSRPHFRRLAALAASLRTPARPLPELSMGTTDDFEVAIEEGATLIRVGTAIFGPRPK